MDNVILKAIFIGIFIIVIGLFIYLLYDYGTFKEDMKKENDAEEKLIKLVQKNYEYYHNLNNTLSSAVNENSRLTVSLQISDSNTKKRIQEIEKLRTQTLKSFHDNVVQYGEYITFLKKNNKELNKSIRFANVCATAKKIKKQTTGMETILNLIEEQTQQIWDILEDVNKSNHIIDYRVKVVDYKIRQHEAVMKHLMDNNLIIAQSVEEFRQYIESHKQFVEQLINTVARFDGIITDMDYVANINQQNINKLNTSNLADENDIIFINNEIDFINNYLIELDERASNLELQISTPEWENIDLEDLDQRASNLRNTIQGYFTRVEELSTEQAGFVNSVSGYQTRMDTNELNATALEGHSLNASNLLQDYRQQLNYLNSDLSDLRNKTLVIQQDISQLENDWQNTSNEVYENKSSHISQDIFDLDTAMRQYFNFHDSYNNSYSLHDNEFNYNVPKVEVLSTLKSPNGLTVHTTRNAKNAENFKICDQNMNCMQLSINNNAFYLSPDSIGNFSIMSGETSLADFDMNQNMISLGKHEADINNGLGRPMVIKDGLVHMDGFDVMNCDPEPAPVVPPPVVAPPAPVLPPGCRLVDDIVKITTSRFHITFLTKRGHVFTMGENLMGVLGLGIPVMTHIYNDPRYLVTSPQQITQLNDESPFPKIIDIATGWVSWYLTNTHQLTFTGLQITEQNPGVSLPRLYDKISFKISKIFCGVLDISPINSPIDRSLYYLIMTKKDTNELYKMDMFSRDNYTETERTIAPIKIYDTDEILKDIVQFGNNDYVNIYLRKDGKVFEEKESGYTGTKGYNDFGFYPNAKMIPDIPLINNLYKQYLIGANNTVYDYWGYLLDIPSNQSRKIVSANTEFGETINPIDIMGISKDHNGNKLLTKQGILYTGSFENNNGFWIENNHMQNDSKKIDNILYSNTHAYRLGQLDGTNAVLTTDSGEVYTIDRYNRIQKLTFPFPPIEPNEQNEENLKKYCPPQVISRPIVDNPIISINKVGNIDIRYQSIAITKTSGEVFLLGYDRSPVPVKITIEAGWGIDDIKFRSFMGFQNSSYLLLDDTGDVYVKGSGSGIGKILGVSNDNVSRLTKNPNLSKIKQISSNGEYYTLFLNEDGEVFYSGSGYNMPNYNYSIPTKIQNLSKVIQIEQTIWGSPVSYFLQEDGYVYMLNLEEMSQLSVQNIKQISLSKQQTDTHILFLNKSGEVYGMGTNDKKQLGETTTGGMQNHWKVENPTKIPGISNVKSVAAGTECSLFLLESGEVFATGKGAQMGIGTTGESSGISKVLIEDCIEIYCLYEASFFVNKYGELFACGENTNGRLGLPIPSEPELSTGNYFNTISIPTKVPIPNTYSRSINIIQDL